MGGKVSMQSGRSDWLREWVGDERMQFFDKVVVLNLSDTAVNDAWLEHLKGLTSLMYLWVNGTQVTDAAVEKLQKTLGVSVSSNRT